MTAADNLALAADLSQQTAQYQSLTEQHTHTGATFDFLAPLPPQPKYRPREWETDTKETR